MTKNEVRTAKLLEMLQLEKKLDVRTSAESLQISEATVRRLFAKLESDGKVIRTHGGVRLVPQLGYDYSYRLSIIHNQREKAAIGKVAANIVDDNDRIFLDSGTTVLKMAEALAIRIQLKELHNIVVLTNSLSHLETVGKLCKVILLGGEIRVERRDVCGPISERNLYMFHVDKAFIGTDAVSRTGDLMTTDERTSRMNELVIERSDHVFVLADSEKFNRSSFMIFSSLEKIDTLITDKKVPQDVLTYIGKLGTKIITASVEERKDKNK